MTGHSAEEIVGSGTGIDAQAPTHKRAVVDKALGLHLKKTNEPEYILQTLGGFEIVAIVGAMLKAYELNMITVVDGYICTAAALGACGINRAARNNLIFSHQSAESGHVLAADAQVFCVIAHCGQPRDFKFSFYYCPLSFKMEQPAADLL